MAERRTDKLREIRLRDPGAIATAAAKRRRRPVIRGDGRLFIVAADHAARGVLGVGRNPLAMVDRDELLERLCVALGRPGVDGVLGTPDIIEDLLLLGALEDKVVIGSMNRGGVRGAVFELDDRFTAYDVPTIVKMGLDGGKMLCRIAPDDLATAPTLEACGRAVTGLAGSRVMALLEPFWARHEHGEEATNDYTLESVIRSVTVASALGATSAYTWLKLPVVDRMEQVLSATTLPVLILGGDPGPDRDNALAGFEQTVRLPGVRGVAAGRSLLYPDDDDVVSAVDAVAAMLGRPSSAMAASLS